MKFLIIDRGQLNKAGNTTEGVYCSSLAFTPVTGDFDVDGYDWEVGVRDDAQATAGRNGVYEWHGRMRIAAWRGGRLCGRHGLTITLRYAVDPARSVSVSIRALQGIALDAMARAWGQRLRILGSVANGD